MRSYRISYTLVGLATLCIAACTNADQERAAQVAIQHDSSLTKDSTDLQRQKDSLLVSVKGLVEAMNAIDSAATAAGVKKEPNTGEPIKPYEAVVRARTVKALHRLRTVEARLRENVAKIKRIGNENAQLKDMATSLQAQMATQQARVDTLIQQLAQAQVREDSLTRRSTQLSTSLDSMVVERQRVFVVAGSKDDLRKKGVVEEVGGTRFPWIVKVGSTLRPTNNPLPDSIFQTFDMMAQRTIDLDPKKRYEVVSTQDLAGADLSNAKGRIFRGSIRVTDPQKFWGPSPYLILRVL